MLSNLCQVISQRVPQIVVGASVAAVLGFLIFGSPGGSEKPSKQSQETQEKTADHDHLRFVRRTFLTDIEENDFEEKTSLGKLTRNGKSSKTWKQPQKRFAQSDNEQARVRARKIQPSPVVTEQHLDSMYFAISSALNE